jgi:hypothetical protein
MKAEAWAEAQRRRTQASQAPTWPAEYTNRRTGHGYRPHHADEADALASPQPRYLYVRGGEGSGKSVFGIVKTLNRLRAGADGILVSPDLPHFKRSLWPEFRNWCPPEVVIPEHRYRLAEHWQPGEPFVLSFISGAHLYCGGIEEPGAWEGPNVNFAHFDEARRARNPEALKVLDGRIRIPARDGTPPQLWITTTPRKNWLFEFFGPETTDDPHAAFKRDARLVTLLTADNAANLSAGYVEQRRQSLTEAEARVLLEAQWEDTDDSTRFLPSMTWWDACREDLPPLTRHEPMVVALDAAISSDSFGLVAVTRHPRRHEDVAVRHVQEWRAPRGGVIDYREPEGVLRALIASWDIVQVPYDPYQLHDMMTRIKGEGIVFVDPFSQMTERLEADKQLLDLIMARRIAHDGNAALRAHVDHADRKPDPESRRLRIVKREPSMKIDLCVTTSMACYRCLRLPL